MRVVSEEEKVTIVYQHLLELQMRDFEVIKQPPGGAQAPKLMMKWTNKFFTLDEPFMLMCALPAELANVCGYIDIHQSYWAKKSFRVGIFEFKEVRQNTAKFRLRMIPGDGIEIRIFTDRDISEMPFDVVMRKIDENISPFLETVTLNGKTYRREKFIISKYSFKQSDDTYIFTIPANYLLKVESLIIHDGDMKLDEAVHSQLFKNELILKHSGNSKEWSIILSAYAEPEVSMNVSVGV